MIEISRQIGGGEAALVNDREKAASTNDEFAALVRRQSRLVFRVAYSVLRNAQDAEDVAQETFLKLYRSGSWKAMDDEAAFLARIAWRTAIDRRPPVRVEVTEADIASPGRSPEQMASASNWISSVHKLIDALPRELREPLLLTALEELTSQQIAKVLAVPEGTVRTRLQRARQMLKAKLAARIGGSLGEQQARRT